jgi:hypothetical protein
MRSEDVDVLSRELGIAAATIAGWRDPFLVSGQARLRARPSDQRDEEIAGLRAKVREMPLPARNVLTESGSVC